MSTQDTAGADVPFEDLRGGDAAWARPSGPTGDMPRRRTSSTKEEAAPSDDDVAPGRPLGRTEYAIVGLMCLMISTIVCAGCFVAFVKKPETFGVIDLPSIVEMEQLSLTSKMMESGVTDQDRAKAYDAVKSFGPRLEAAIEDVRSRCKCVLLTQNAFVGKTDNDFTADVKRQLGMDSLDANVMKDRITKNLQAAPDLPKR